MKLKNDESFLFPMLLMLCNLKFGPKVQKKLDTLINEYKNVFVTCSKLGKLTKALYTDYLKYCLSPYVENNKFLFLIWR